MCITDQFPLKPQPAKMPHEIMVNISLRYGIFSVAFSA
jgi:hypothetical protein